MSHLPALTSLLATVAALTLGALGIAGPVLGAAETAAAGTVAAAATATTTPVAAGRPVILLKLDDLGHAGKQSTASVSPRWQRLTDFLAANQLKASYGIIGDSLEGDFPAYIAWIKQVHASGLIEFWDHGYLAGFPKTPTLSAFKGTTLAQQTEFLTKTQTLAKDKLGFDLKAFGPHDSAVDDNTYRALATRPEITMVFYYTPVSEKTLATQFVFERRINLEEPIFHPNPASVRAKFEKSGHALPYLCMQGHPDMWDDARFAAFSETVLYLKAQGCVFMQPSEYLAAHGPAAP